MEISLFWHIATHLTVSLLIGYLVFLWSRKFLISMISAVVSGTGVDLDHFIDYFMVFGRNFRWEYFTNGYEFLKSDKIRLLFHGWEYVIILSIAAYFIKNKAVRVAVISLMLGLLSHLTTDSLLNEGMRPRSYSMAIPTTWGIPRAI